MTKDHSKERAGKSYPRMELLMILASGILVYFLSYRYDFLERIVHFTREHENWQPDEFLVVSAFFMIAFAVYSFRRWRDLQRSNNQLILKNGELQAALDEIKRLRGILPICSSCKKIRDDQGYWHEVESYIRDHSEAEFSHSLCPDCMNQLYPDFIEEIAEK